MLLERRKNASDTLGIQDFFPSHQLPVELSVTVKTGLDGQLRKRVAADGSVIWFSSPADQRQQVFMHLVQRV